MNSSCTGTSQRGAACYLAKFSSPLSTISTDAVCVGDACFYFVCIPGSVNLKSLPQNQFEITRADPFTLSWRSSPGCRGHCQPAFCPRMGVPVSKREVVARCRRRRDLAGPSLVAARRTSTLVRRPVGARFERDAFPLTACGRQLAYDDILDVGHRGY